MFRSLVAAFLCLVLPPLANAAPIRYAFTGTILQVSANPPSTEDGRPLSVGKQIPIVITLAEGAPFLHQQTPGSYFGFGSGQGGLFASAEFAGTPIQSLIQTLEIVAGRSIHFNETGPQLSYGYDILLSGALPGTLPNTDIPQSLDPSRFTEGTFSVTQLFAPEVMGFSGTINLVPPEVAVPEPASLALMLAGLAVLCRARRRHA